MSSDRTRAFAAGARELVFRAGGLALLRAANRSGVRIIAYHRFPDSCAKTLRAQCRYLRQAHELVALRQIDRWLDGGAPLPPRAVAVTVDDGYRDFYRVAYPIFCEYGIPVTMFLATGFLDRSCWLWGDLVRYAFRRTSLREAELVLGSAAARFRLSTEREKTAAADAVKQAAKRLDHQARLELLYDQLPAALEVALPEAPPDEYAPLAWDEVREMHANGMRFGGHTQTHPILSSVRSETRLAAEVVGSKRRIEEELGQPVYHFAYPNGCFPDIDSGVVGHVRRAGYASAVLAEPGLNRRSADRYTLRRNMVEPETPLPWFGRNVLRSA